MHRTHQKISLGKRIFSVISMALLLVQSSSLSAFLIPARAVTLALPAVQTYADDTFVTQKTEFYRGDAVYFQASELNETASYRLTLTNPKGVGENLEPVDENTWTMPEAGGTISTWIGTAFGDELGTWTVTLLKLIETEATECETECPLPSEETIATSTFSLGISTNPVLSNSCGLDIALVLDDSDSIDETELLAMKNAFHGFVNSLLPQTPTQFALVHFNTEAYIDQEFTSDAAVINQKINNVSKSAGWTNWEDALLKVKSVFGGREDHPDLVIFASDGNPSYPYCPGEEGCTENIDAAIDVANEIKAEGIRMMTIGIGDYLDETNLQAISGPNVNTGATADVVTTDFATMAATLKEISSNLCGATISFNKYIENEDTRGAAGWTFAVGEKSLVTDENGQVNSGKLTAGTYVIGETNIPAGFELGSASCSKNGEPVGRTVDSGEIELALSNTDVVTCNFINVSKPGTLTVTVFEDMNGNGVADSTDTGLGGWNVGLVPGESCEGKTEPSETDENGNAVFTDLEAGTYSVFETAQDGWNATTETCQTVNIVAGESAQAAFGNYRPATVSGTVYADKNLNGAMQSGEVGLKDWTVYLDQNNNGKFDTTELSTKTDTNGNYAFASLMPGNYTVREAQQDGWKQTGPVGGVNTVTATSGLVSQNNNFGNAQADISITKVTDKTSAKPGDTIVFTLSVENNGPTDATNVLVTETVPEGTVFSYPDSLALWSCKDGAVAGTVCTFPLDTVWAHTTKTISFSVKVVGPVIAGFDETVNTAVAASEGNIDPDLTNNTSSADAAINAAPDLSVAITDGLDSVKAGDELTYTVTAANVGNQDATGVTTTVVLPANTAFVSASDGGVVNNGKVSWKLSGLKAGGEKTYTVTVKVAANIAVTVTSLTGSATVADDGANGTDPDLANNSASDTDKLAAVLGDDTKKDPEPDVVIIQEPTEDSEGGDVLGDNTTSLPNTGRSLFLLSYSISLLLTGVVLRKIRIQKKQS